MAKLIVVCGATGQLGGSAARRMLKEGWQVRAVTRNPSSPAALALADAGAQLVVADYDDEASLAKAFEGAHAIFAVTQFWDYLMTLGAIGAGEKEYEQIMRIATVANGVSTLEHFVLHSLASGEKLVGKVIPHWDYKARAVDNIKATLPELAAKSTWFWVGWFSSNMWTGLKPVEVVSACIWCFVSPRRQFLGGLRHVRTNANSTKQPGSYGGYLWVNPVPESCVMHISGDIETNVGVYLAAVLANPKLTTPAKYIHVATDVLRYEYALKQWNEVTGKRAIYLNSGVKKFKVLFGPVGEELNAQFTANNEELDWHKGVEKDMVSAAELGIKGKLLNHRQSLELNKKLLL